MLEVEQEDTQICKSKQDIVNPVTKDDSEPQYLCLCKTELNESKQLKKKTVSFDNQLD